jgi:hypothetical protein
LANAFATCAEKRASPEENVTRMTLSRSSTLRLRSRLPANQPRSTLAPVAFAKGPAGGFVREAEVLHDLARDPPAGDALHLSLQVAELLLRKKVGTHVAQGLLLLGVHEQRSRRLVGLGHQQARAGRGEHGGGERQREHAKARAQREQELLEAHDARTSFP